MKRVVATKKAPAAIGPYSQGNITGNLIFTAGQIPIDPETGELVEPRIEIQTRRALLNLKAILEEAGSGMEKIVKTTVFLSDMTNFAKMNEIYKEFFSDDFPARSAVQVARLPKDAMIEIEAIAML